MRASVSAVWYTSIKSYEGYTNWLYFDTHNPPLATTGVGNMIDAGGKLNDFGLALPWQFKDGTYATEKQISAEYTRLKALGINKQGGYAYKDYAELFLDEDVVKWMVALKTDEFFNILEKFFTEIEMWPADAQLAIMNMAWWMGPNFVNSWPNFSAACKAQDWIRASENCTTVNPSARNPHNVKRFLNAAKVRFGGLDPEVLYDQFDAPGLVSISANKVATAKASVYNQDAEYVQRMLAELGFYSVKIDGLFGNMSKTAFANWAKVAKQSNVINVTTLNALSKASLMMRVTS